MNPSPDPRHSHNQARILPKDHPMIPNRSPLKFRATAMPCACTSQSPFFALSFPQPRSTHDLIPETRPPHRRRLRQFTLLVSTDGITWSSQSSGDTGAFSTGSSSYTFTAASGQTVVSKTVAVTGLSIINGSSYYIRWNFDTTGANSQGLGLDNLVLT